MMENSGEIINVGLAVEVVKWCDELCLGWKSANECRGHLDKVKAQSYIDKYEMKLCEAGMTCETSFQNVQALISVAKDARVKRQGGVTAVVTLLDLVVQASTIAQSEGWLCPDLLEAVSRDVSTFAKEMGIESRLTPTAWAPAARGNSNTKSLTTKTFKRTTKPSVRVARSGSGASSSMSCNGTRRRRVRPEERVQLRDTKNNNNNYAAPAVSNAAVSMKKKKKRSQQGKIYKGRVSREAHVPQPELAVSSVNYNMKTNPFAHR